MNQLGIVIIGRNEGERLRRCLASVVGCEFAVVYVDSGSTDGSVELARAMGVEVVELDMSHVFTAARARNAGFARLEQVDPGIKLVQFVDGDCEVVQGWLDHARRAFSTRDLTSPSSLDVAASVILTKRSTTGWPTLSGICRLARSRHAAAMP